MTETRIPLTEFVREFNAEIMKSDLVEKAQASNYKRSGEYFIEPLAEGMSEAKQGIRQAPMRREFRDANFESEYEGNPLLFYEVIIDDEGNINLSKMDKATAKERYMKIAVS